MKNKVQFVSFSIFLAAALASSANADQKYSATNSSEVDFVAKITGGSFTVKSKEVSGYVVMDDAGKKIVSAEITVPASSLDSGMSMRNDHMQNKYLEAGKFPNITFSFKEPVDVQSNSASKIVGEFNIRDNKKTANVDASIKPSSGNKMEISSDFPINITDYGIEQPKFAVVKMDTTVNVHVDLILEKK